MPYTPSTPDMTRCMGQENTKTKRTINISYNSSQSLLRGSSDTSWNNLLQPLNQIVPNSTRQLRIHRLNISPVRNPFTTKLISKSISKGRGTYSLTTHSDKYFPCDAFPAAIPPMRVRLPISAVRPMIILPITICIFSAKLASRFSSV